MKNKETPLHESKSLESVTLTGKQFRAFRDKTRDDALEEAANTVASINTLGMTAPSAVTKLCAAIRSMKGK